MRGIYGRGGEPLRRGKMWSQVRSSLLHKSLGPAMERMLHVCLAGTIRALVERTQLVNHERSCDPACTGARSLRGLSFFSFGLRFWVAMADAEKKVFSLEEVSQHNHSRDCWLVIGGKVYDVTKFLEEHPGGDEVLLSATGKDATDDFEDVGHSTSARAMMDEYYVGEIDVSTIPSKPTYTPAKQASYNPDKSSEFLIKILQFVVPLAILALAVAVRFFTKNQDVDKK